MNFIMKGMLVFFIIAVLQFTRSSPINNSHSTTIEFVNPVDFTTPSEEALNDISTNINISSGLRLKSSGERQKSLMNSKTTEEKIIIPKTGEIGLIGLLSNTTKTTIMSTTETSNAGSVIPSKITGISEEAMNSQMRSDYPKSSVVSVKVKNRGSATESIKTGLTALLPESTTALITDEYIDDNLSTVTDDTQEKSNYPKHATISVRIKNSVVGTDPTFTIGSTGLLLDSKKSTTMEPLKAAESSIASLPISPEETMTSLFNTTMTNRFTNFSTTLIVQFPTDIVDNNTNGVTGSQITTTIHGKISQMQTTEFDNISNPCDFVKCKNGAQCVFIDKHVWCNCSWAYSGSLCENAIPVYLILGLVGAAIVVLFLFGMLIYKCVKDRSERIKPNVGSLDRKLNLIENFNRTDSCAIYADPMKYRTAPSGTTKFDSTLGVVGGTVSSSQHRQCTIPRPRIILESFSDTDGQVEYSNGYATFKRLPLTHNHHNNNADDTGSTTLEQPETVA